MSEKRSHPLRYLHPTVPEPLLVSGMRRRPTGEVIHQPSEGGRTGTSTGDFLAEFDAYVADREHHAVLEYVETKETAVIRLETPEELDSVIPLAVKAAVNEALVPIEKTIAGLAEGTRQFMADYEDQGKGISRRISGEAAALIVEQRERLRESLESALAEARSQVEKP